MAFPYTTSKHLSAKARLQEEHSYQPAKHVHTHKEPKTYLQKASST
ncbi:MAG: hypothetical protein ACLT38_06065 [Akkermansia sp.]